MKFHIVSMFLYGQLQKICNYEDVTTTVYREYFCEVYISRIVVTIEFCDFYFSDSVQKHLKLIVLIIIIIIIIVPPTALTMK